MVGRPSVMQDAVLRIGAASVRVVSSVGGASAMLDDSLERDLLMVLALTP